MSAYVIDMMDRIEKLEECINTYHRQLSMSQDLNDVLMAEIANLKEKLEKKN